MGLKKVLRDELRRRGWKGADDDSFDLLLAKIVYENPALAEQLETDSMPAVAAARELLGLGDGVGADLVAADASVGDVIVADRDPGAGAVVDHVLGSRLTLKKSRAKEDTVVKALAKRAATEGGLDWRLLSKSQRRQLRAAVKRDLAAGVDPLAQPQAEADGEDIGALAKVVSGFDPAAAVQAKLALEKIATHAVRQALVRPGNSGTQAENFGSPGWRPPR